MGASHSLKRSYDQAESEVESGESSCAFSEGCHDNPDIENEFDKSSPQATKRPKRPIEAETDISESSRAAISGSRDQSEVESEVSEPSNSPHHNRGRRLESNILSYRRRESSFGRRLEQFLAQESSASKILRRPRSNAVPKRLPDQQPKISPSATLPTSLTTINGSHKPDARSTPPSRPTFTQLATDGQQGMKVLFLVDHATKGDAIHHAIKAYVDERSPEMKLLMSRYLKERCKFQHLFFKKARKICVQLTSRYEFLELERAGVNRDRRLGYFNDQCTEAYLANLYSHIASAVDIPSILAAQMPNEKAFKRLMTQVFVRSMEDLWCLEFHPSKRNLSAKVERENKEELYGRFRDLTDRFDGLPAARDMPGYLDVPLRADFPRYVLLGQTLGPLNERDVYESDEEGDRGIEDGDVSCP